MNEVIKYEEGDPCAGMYESAEGVWVHIDDYDQLKEKLDYANQVIDQRHAMLDAIRKQLDEARELLTKYGYSTGDIDGRVYAWLERNKG